jgi:hypothetical protein
VFILEKGNKKNSGKKTLNSALLLLLVASVVAVSGCISNLGFGSQPVKVEAPNDVMVFQDNVVIPNPPVLTGDTFTTAFNIKNLDELEYARETKLLLYDWGVCTPSLCIPGEALTTAEGTSCSGSEADGTLICTSGVKETIGWETIDTNKLKSSYSAGFGDVSPQDIQHIECQFKVPSADKIGGMDARCPVRYSMIYDFKGITTTDLNVISNTKFQEMQRAGQTPTVTPVQSKSRGPIKVDLSFGTTQPVKTSSAGNDVKIPMYIKIENKGAGNVKIETDAESASYLVSLRILVPSELVPDKNCEAFKCEEWLTGKQATLEGGGYDTNKCVLLLDNDKKITKDMFVKGKTQSFKCEFTSPDEKTVPELKTYSMQAITGYTYQVDNDFNVAIKPLNSVW